MPHRTGAGIALLADPTRRAIVAAVALRPRRPSRLADALRLSRSVVSRQLRLLEEGGIVVSHDVPGDGRAVLYTINPFRHGAITAWLAGTEVAFPAGAVGYPRAASADGVEPGPPTDDDSAQPPGDDSEQRRGVVRPFRSLHDR